MLTDIRAFFAENLIPHDGSHGEKQQYEIRYAAAALLVTCAKADFVEDPDEQKLIVGLLEKKFGIDHEMIVSLMEYADEQTGVKGLQEFTNLVNEHYSDEDKTLLIENLWRVAYADGRLDKFEEQFVSRVAFMIDVSPDEVQVSKDAVATQGASEAP